MEFSHRARQFLWTMDEPSKVSKTKMASKVMNCWRGWLVGWLVHSYGRDKQNGFLDIKKSTHLWGKMSFLELVEKLLSVDPICVFSTDDVWKTPPWKRLIWNETLTAFGKRSLRWKAIFIQIWVPFLGTKNMIYSYWGQHYEPYSDSHLNILLPLMLCVINIYHPNVYSLNMQLEIG